MECPFIIEAGKSSDILSFKSLSKAWDLSRPEINNIISLLLKIVEIPIVIAWVGTSSTELKKRELAILVE